jgi:hypothetical protein
MKVSELIEALRAMPQNAPVVYFNRCADDGTYSVSVDNAEVQTRQQWMAAPEGMPVKCVVLS